MAAVRSLLSVLVHAAFVTLTMTAFASCAKEEKAPRMSSNSDGAVPGSPQASTQGAPALPKAPPPTADPSLPSQVEGDFVVKNFRFGSGETLPEVRLHYTTLGAPHKDAQGRVDNAVLLLHGTTGRGKEFFADSFRGAMFGPGQPLDVTKYFVILPDNVGHGQSSKPSDSLHARFPHYAYGDMLELQHRLVTAKLGLTHLRLVAGISMGGMHTWMWAGQYPDMMDAAIPIACEPNPVTGRNLLWRRIIIEATKSDPGYAGGEYTEVPRGYAAVLPLFHMMVNSPAHLLRTISTVEKATDFIQGDFGDAHPPVDANDAIYALDASRDYAPDTDLEKIKARVLAINFADDELNVASLGAVERVMPRVRGGRYVLVPATPQTNGHMTLILAEQWGGHVASFLQHLK